jgi:hypothetical protein
MGFQQHFQWRKLFSSLKCLARNINLIDVHHAVFIISFLHVNDYMHMIGPTLGTNSYDTQAFQYQQTF